MQKRKILKLFVAFAVDFGVCLVQGRGKGRRTGGEAHHLWLCIHSFAFHSCPHQCDTHTHTQTDNKKYVKTCLVCLPLAAATTTATPATTKPGPALGNRQTRQGKAGAEPVRSLWLELELKTAHAHAHTRQRSGRAKQHDDVYDNAMMMTMIIGNKIIRLAKGFCVFKAATTEKERERGREISAASASPASTSSPSASPAAASSSSSSSPSSCYFL